MRFKICFASGDDLYVVSRYKSVPKFAISIYLSETIPIIAFIKFC